METENWIVIDQEISVAGRVLDNETNDPVTAVNIEIKDSLGTYCEMTTSQSDGAYFFSNLPDGQSHIKAEAFALGTRYQVWEDTDLKIPINDMSERITTHIRLVPTCIEGMVTDSQDETTPVGGAKIRIWGESVGVFADQAGKYRLGPVLAGSLIVVVSARGYREKRQTINNLSVGEKKEVNIALSRLSNTPKTELPD